MLIGLLLYPLYPWPELRSRMSLGKAGSSCRCWVTPMPTPSCLEVVLLQHTEESSLVLLFLFVCSTQTCEKRKGTGKDRISFASALWWSIVNSFLTYLNFAQKSTLHYSSTCLGHVNSSVRKIYFSLGKKSNPENPFSIPMLVWYAFSSLVLTKFSFYVYVFVSYYGSWEI